MTANAKSFEERAKSEPTDLHKNFAEWLFIQTGIKPDLKTVQIVCAMRMDFQRSEENQKHLKDRKAKAAAAKKASAANKKAKLEAQLAKLKADLEKVESEPAAAEQPAEKPAPAQKAVASKPATPKATPKPRTRRAPVKKTTPDVPADFDADDLTDSNNAKPAPRRTRRTAATKTA